MDKEFFGSLFWVNDNERTKWESSIRKLNEEEIEVYNAILKDRAEVKRRLRHYIDPNYFYNLSNCYKIPFNENPTLSETLHALQTNIVSLYCAVKEYQEMDRTKAGSAKRKRDRPIV